MENVKTELVDALHFIVSSTILSGFTETRWLDGEIERAFMAGYRRDYDGYYDSLIDAIDTLISNTYVSPPHTQLLELCRVANLAGMTYEEMYRRYIVKNVLNEFRRANGYKEGRYIKEWRKNTEDNVVALEVAGDIPVDSDFKEKLSYALSKVYTDLTSK